MDEQEAKLILAFADGKMILHRASQNAYMSRGSVVYHLKKIHNTTGLNPYNFYDLYQLTVLAKEIMAGGGEQ